MKLRDLVIVAAIFCLPWLVNAYKLFNCDFTSDYKCEAIHATGVFVPPLAFITVWFDSDK
jgi:hypothetical protein